MPSILGITFTKLVAYAAKKTIYKDNPTQGNILIGNGSGAISELAPSTTKKVPVSDGTNWVARVLVVGDISDFGSYQPLDGDLTAIAGLSGMGFAKRTGTNTWTVASLVVADISDIATNYQSLDTTLTSLAAFNTNGLLTQTAADTFVARTVTAGTGISVTNGSGVSGNPTIAIDSTVVTLTGSQTLTNKILTAPAIADLTNVQHGHTGTTSGGTLGASAIASGQLALARGGTGVDLSAAGGTNQFLAEDASHIVTARAITASDLSTLIAKQIMYFIRAGAGVAAGTLYQSPSSTSLLGTETLSNTKMPFACTIKNLYLRTTGTQPSSGSLIITLRVNNNPSTLTLTVAANATAAEFSDSTHSVSISAGDEIDMQFVNGASGTSATLNVLSIEIDTPLS